MATKNIVAGFVWNTPREKALHLTFEGGWTLRQIAELCDVSPRTISDWQTKPEFQERLAQMRAALEAHLDAVTYAKKAARILALDQMAKSARAEYLQHPWLQEKRQIGFDKEHEEPLYLINESFNRDAFESFRGALDDIAKELGQRKSGADMTVNVQQQNVLFVVPEKTSEHVTRLIEQHTSDATP